MTRQVICIVAMALTGWLFVSAMAKAGNARTMMKKLVAHCDKWQDQAVLFCHGTATAAFWAAVESGLFALLLHILRTEEAR